MCCNTGTTQRKKSLRIASKKLEQTSAYNMPTKSTKRSRPARNVERVGSKKLEQASSYRFQMTTKASMKPSLVKKPVRIASKKLEKTSPPGDAKYMNERRVNKLIRKLLERHDDDHRLRVEVTLIKLSIRVLVVLLI